MPPVSPQPDSPGTLRAVGIWLLDKAGAAAVGLLVVAAMTGLALLLFGGSDADDEPPPPLSTQWLHERAAIARKGWRIAETRKVDLRGIGEPSTIFVLSPPAKSCTDPNAAGSQQVRVYDVDEGRLERALTFQPKLDGCPPMQFEFVRIAPLREYDDAPLILGRFDGGIDSFSDEISVPVVIAWDDRSQRYTLRPLLVRPPRLVEVADSEGKPLRGFDRRWYRQAREVFGHPVDLGSGFGGYAVTDFGFGHSGFLAAPIVAGIYRLTAGNAAGGRRMISSPIVEQPVIWALETSPEGVLYAGECSLERVVESTRGLDDSMTRLVKRADDMISTCAEY